MNRGEYEILDQHVFPGDNVGSVVNPRTPRSRSLGRSPGTPVHPQPGTPVHRSARSGSEPPKTKIKTSQDVVGRLSGEEAHHKAELTRTSQESVKKNTSGSEAIQEAGFKKNEKKVVQDPQKTVGDPPAASSSPQPFDSVPTSGERSPRERSPRASTTRLIRDPGFDPGPAMVAKGRSTSELFQQPLFKKQRREHGEETPMEDETAAFEAEGTVNWNNVSVVLDIPLPQKNNQWKHLKRSPESYFVKKVRSAEVNIHDLPRDEQAKFEAAKEAEVHQWLKAAAVRRVTGTVPPDRVVQMRWVLTYKSDRSAKGRIVLIGYQDPDLQDLQSSAPTMCRRTRQLTLQMSSVMQWHTLKADVKAAFLQGDATESSRQLFAKPVPELARALGISEKDVVQVMKSCYGLVTAPASWFGCVNRTLKEIGFRQCKSDPCLWVLPRAAKDGDEPSIEGYICAHVDDFLISGDESSGRWAEALHAFYARFT